MATYQMLGSCWATKELAIGAFIADRKGTVLRYGGNDFFVMNGWLSSSVGAYQLELVSVGGGSGFNVTFYQSVSECTLPEVGDGIAIGWLVGAAMIAVFALKFIVRGLRGETGGSYGST